MVANRFRCLVVPVVVLALAGCATVSRVAPTDSGEPSLREVHRAVFELSSYDFDPSTGVVQRVNPMPDFVLEYIEALDGQDYERYSPSNAERTLIAQYVDELPPRMRRVMQRRLIGIYFVEDAFMGGGMAVFALSEHGEPYVFMIVNAMTLRLSLSEWITYRENTAFAGASEDGGPGPFSIRAECGDRYRGFMHILLHEGTHLVDYVEGITPQLQESMEWFGFTGDSASTAFQHGIWRDSNTPRRRYDFDRRQEIAFYGLRGGPHLDIGDASQVYDDLEETPFASLYAVLSVSEDLAELVTWNHLVHHLDQENRIIVEGEEGVVADISLVPDPITERRRTLIESFY